VHVAIAITALQLETRSAQCSHLYLTTIPYHHTRSFSHAGSSCSKLACGMKGLSHALPGTSSLARTSNFDISSSWPSHAITSHRRSYFALIDDACSDLAKTFRRVLRTSSNGGWQSAKSLLSVETRPNLRKASVLLSQTAPLRPCHWPGFAVSRAPGAPWH
jgi:hypothetical protein